MTAGDVRVEALGSEHGPSAVSVINEAASWYAEFLPPAAASRPEMTLDEWVAEGRRMTWYGAFANATLVGVMGLEYAGDAALLRHAYVLSRHQRRGVAAALHAHIVSTIGGVDKIIVGTYAANFKARRLLEKAGYRLSADSQAVLRHYFDIPGDRARNSVTYERHLSGPL